MEEGYLLSSQINVLGLQVRTMKYLEYNDQSYVIGGDSKGNIIIVSIKAGKFKHIKNCNVCSNTITSMEFLASSEFYDKPSIVIGDRNGLVQFFSVSSLVNKEITPKKVFEISQFNDCICNLKSTKDGKIIFDSWDLKTRIYSKSGKYIEMSQGVYAAWCSKEDSKGQIISGCADGSLKIWSSDGKLIQTIEHAHKESVRDILLYKNSKNEEIILSIGNDGVLNEWVFTSHDTLQQNRSVTVTISYIYSFVIANNNVIIGSEDKVLYNVDLIQFEVIDIIPIGSVVWATQIMPNGNIIAGCDDGSIRSFTLHADEKASDQEHEAYLHYLKKLEINPSHFRGIPLDDIPYQPDDNCPRGYFCPIRCKKGIALMIQNRGYKKWVCVGKSIIEQRKKDPHGREYDTSFTILIGDDSLTMYVRFEDTAEENADTFCKDHNLGPRDRNEIIEFLNENFKVDQLGKTQKRKAVTVERSGSFKYCYYGLAETQGMRSYMQDACCEVEYENGTAFFGVFDGHGSEVPAIYAAEQMPSIVEKNEMDLEKSFKEIDSKMIQFEICGTTAAVALIKDDFLFVGNLGDSRVVLCRENPIRMTVDHKAEDPEEANYIREHGGTVTQGKVSGLLAVSRSLGDSILLKYANHNPHLSQMKLITGDRILIACDGLFDVYSDEEASNDVRKATDPLSAAIQLRDDALFRGSGDNISVMVIFIK
ncbi:protein phosphatase 2C [Tritrichomonas foetus]|uniref:Protein phosphatase 2C n=1 Tax=Tritrichomonas foetus TaxID=1144522 RepID=A0A1J4JL57_9EUKA|nr:protein phosphatase 2C [Tritrichomonas foetus]|eukprot:OHS99840.1 protein phosphatase 2C [Tritrichomonas foetus]